MALKVIRVNTLKAGFNQPNGVLGDHHLLYFPKASRVLGFSSKGDLISTVEVEKTDVLLYNCGEIKVMTPWRVRVYNLTGKLVKVVDEIPADQEVYGEHIRRINPYIGYILKEGKERTYLSSILTTKPEELLKFLGKKDACHFFKGGHSTREFWRAGTLYENISFFGYNP